MQTLELIKSMPGDKDKSLCLIVVFILLEASYIFGVDWMLEMKIRFLMIKKCCILSAYAKFYLKYH